MEHTSGTPINMCRNETENTVDALFLTNVTDPSDVRRNDTRKKRKKGDDEEMEGKCKCHWRSPEKQKEESKDT